MHGPRQPLRSLSLRSLIWRLTRVVKDTLHAFLLLVAAFSPACRDTSNEKKHQPLTLHAATTSIGAESKLHARRYRRYSPHHYRRPLESISYEIWLMLSQSAYLRWSELPIGTEFVCSTPNSVIGRTKVERPIGAGYSFRLVYPFHYVFGCFENNVYPTILLAFNMLTAGSIPPLEAGGYVNLMDGCPAYCPAKIERNPTPGLTRRCGAIEPRLIK